MEATVKHYGNMSTSTASYPSGEQPATQAAQEDFALQRTLTSKEDPFFHVESAHTFLDDTFAK